MLTKFKKLIDSVFSVKFIDNHVKIFFCFLKFNLKIKYKMPKITLKESGILTEKRDVKLIVSLTSFPARIKDVHKTITTLLNQTVKPDEVILWLAESQFPDKEAGLPKELLDLCNWGLTIEWTEDLRSYKKLVPALIKYPNDIIVIFDDDFYYDSRLLENLYNAYLKQPQYVHANRASRVTKDKDNKLKLNKQSLYIDETYQPSYLNENMTGCGTLYPPHSLHPDTVNKNLFMNIIPTNDDIWNWAMAVRNRTKTVINSFSHKNKLIYIENSQNCGLFQINHKNSDEGIDGTDGLNLMVKEFPEIMEIMQEDFEK